MTIEEIAKLAGVSRTAVSRYLNNGYVSEEKKEKIRKVIEETGYHPSRQAQMLRTKKTKLIGVVLPKISSEAVSRIVSGISQAVTGEGFQILLADTENNVQKELEYLNLFKNNQVDGILFIATLLSKKHKTILKSLEIPAVVIGQRTDYISCVYHDDFNAARELTELFLAAGRKRIAYIGVTARDIAAGLERKNGFLKAFQVSGQKLPDLMAEGDFSMESGYTKMEELWEKDKTIDAVFCATDSIAIGAMNYLKEQGLSLPRDVSIVGIGHTKMSEVVAPKLTTAHYYYKTSGIEGANMLLSMIKQDSAANKELKLGYQIIQQESV